MKRKKKYGAPCMRNFDTVNSLLQSVDSHGLLGGLTDGLPSTLGNARSRFKRDRTSLRCPPSPVCVCVLSSHSFWTSMDVPAGVTRRYFQHAHFIPIVGVGKRGEY